MCNNPSNRLEYYGYGSKLVLIYSLFEKRDYLLRHGVCGHIPVLWRAAENEIADRPTHDICLESGILKSLGYMCNIRGNCGRI